MMLRSSALLLIVLSCVMEPAVSFTSPKPLLKARQSVNNGWTSSSSSRHHRSSSSLTMYVPTPSPTSITSPMSAQQILSTQGGSRPDQSPAMFSSLSLASRSEPQDHYSSSIPNGLLSPATVMKMDKLTSVGERNEVIALFLDTYRQKGPMSCLPFLSDPSVLPHLTAAMRDVSCR